MTKIKVGARLCVEGYRNRNRRMFGGRMLVEE